MKLGFDAERLAVLDRHFQRYVDDGRLPGWSLLISRFGEVAHASTYGLRDVEAALPVDDDTLFRMYSMTKPVTSVAVMMLYEQGAFELTDPVADYLPAFADQRVMVGGTASQPVTVPAVEPVRIRHLLTHTSGLTAGFQRVDPVDEIYRSSGFEFGSPAGLDLAGCVDRWASFPLLFQPGTGWNYSVATDVLGRLVEVVSGQPFDVFLRERLFGPLGMDDTMFHVPAEKADRLAWLYAPDRRNGGIARRNGMARAALKPPRYLSGAGGLIATRADYQRFAQMLCDGGELDGVRILGDRTVRFMTANHLPGGVDMATFGRSRYSEVASVGTGFGLGFSVVLDPVATGTLGSVGEFGWGGMASTVFWVDPVERMTVIFLTQLVPSGTYPLRSQLHQLIYPALTGS